MSLTGSLACSSWVLLQLQGKFVSCTPGKFAAGLERASVLAYSAVWFPLCSLGPNSFPQEIACCMPLLFKHWLSLCSSYGEGLSSPSTGREVALSSSAHELRNCCFTPVGFKQSSASCCLSVQDLPFRALSFLFMHVSESSGVPAILTPLHYESI
jgi:hypothetical protein